MSTEHAPSGVRIRSVAVLNIYAIKTYCNVVGFYPDSNIHAIPNSLRTYSKLSTPKSGFEKLRIIRVDGSRIRKEKVANY